MYHLLAGSPLSPPVNYINEETRDDKRARGGGTTRKLITDNSLFFLRQACFGDNGHSSWCVVTRVSRLTFC